ARPPVVRVALERQRIAARSERAAEHERPRPDRVLPERRLVLPAETRRHDPVREGRDIREQGRPGRGQVRDYRRRTLGLELRDREVEEAQRALLVRTRAVDREDDVGGRQRLAVRELHAWAELEREGLLVRAHGVT